MNLKFDYFSGIYQLTSEQTINASMDEIWDFFSSPKNLDKITPKNMSFKITSKLTDETYEGQIITYKIEILPMINSSWVTEIITYVEKEYFIDEQRFGPYSMWHHEHHFKALPDGKVLMTDRISYKLPFGLLGRLIAGRLIKNKLKGIFAYRFHKIEEFFNLSV